MQDKNRKDNELFIQATELLRVLMRNEHLYEDIAKMLRIINTKNILKNEIIEKEENEKFHDCQITKM